MGKWAKGHLKPKNALNPLAGMKDLSARAKDDINPDVPGESPEEKALRDRQALELTRLDDEENRRIKSMFAAGGARKLFRSSRSSAGSRAGASASAGGSASSGASGAASGGAAGGRPVFSGRSGSLVN